MDKDYRTYVSTYIQTDLITIKKWAAKKRPIVKHPAKCSKEFQVPNAKEGLKMTLRILKPHQLEITRVEANVVINHVTHLNESRKPSLME